MARSVRKRANEDGKNERRELSVDGVADIETEKWDGFIVGGILDCRNGNYSEYWWQREDDYIDALLAFDGTVWLHNGGKFDSLHFLEHMRRRGERALIFLAGQRIVALEVGSLILRDSAALAPMKLDDLGALAGLSKSSTGLRCRCPKHLKKIFAFRDVGENGCGGYCRINRKMNTRERNELSGYLRNDCKVLASGLVAIQDFAEENDLDLCGTIGASSWKSAQRMLSLPDAEWTYSDYDFARRGYFGGRTQVFRPTVKSGYRYDINSAYPAALAAVSVPYGDRCRVMGASANASYRTGAEGIYRAIVTVPEMHIPPLPVRNEREHRVAFPFGRMVGDWAGNELRYAETVGAHIEEVVCGLVWDRSAPLLEPYVRKLWALRAKAGPKTPFGKWLKLYINSLTGKLAQRPEGEKVEMWPNKITGCPARYKCKGIHRKGNKRCCIHECYKNCGAMTPLGKSSKIFIKNVYRPSPCAHVQWAAYLTADTRTRQLHSQLVDDSKGGETVIYCDTDSCYSTTRRTKNIGKDLGQWDFEGRISPAKKIKSDKHYYNDWGRYPAPKTYEYIDEWGEVHARSKGIPDASHNFDLLTQEGGIKIDRGVLSLKSACKAGGTLFKRKEMHRQVHADGIHFGDRILSDGNLTRPMNYEHMFLDDELDIDEGADSID